MVLGRCWNLEAEFESYNKGTELEILSFSGGRGGKCKEPHRLSYREIKETVGVKVRSIHIYLRNVHTTICLFVIRLF